uniref:serine/threonine-protein phosphatase PGAM5, mitochondrial n=1 Tax=Urocitellus parryii TaxID=9999 RepID=UPI000E55ADCF|nr:serine/threonine-protein phosphatase PGAM5, mitochondrial [Urocitellus parryii]
MAFRQALQLAACGLAGGSAAMLFSAVAVGKPRTGGDLEPRAAEAPAWAGGARPCRGVWDPNWDRREPLSLVNLRKRNVESGEEEQASRLDHYRAKATRHIFLIRHSQYHMDGCLEKDRTLTPLGNYIHRADAKQEEDSYEIFICHANVIRYIVCRALQFPPEGWLRLSLNNGSITHLVIRPDGRVALRTLGDTGFMPPNKITRS